MPLPDLFGDSTMTFGEHLEVLRRHLFRSVLYLLVAAVPAAFLAEAVLDAVTSPIEKALEGYDATAADDPAGDDHEDNLLADAVDDGTWWGRVKAYLPGYGAAKDAVGKQDRLAALRADEVRVSVARGDLEAAGVLLAEGTPDRVSLVLRAPELVGLRPTGLVTKSVTEAFTVYIKTIVVTAFLIASPLILGELWLFVGAGLYPHERKYVYYFLPVSLFLFAAGAAFCFLVVFQFVLPFLLSFNDIVDTTPLIEAGGWFGFVLILPAVFGLSFQLPLVMLFFNRIGAVSTEAYWRRTNLAILIIAGVSMLLTPTDPGSMIAMMIPLTGLYFVGIAMCKYFPAPPPGDPFAEEDAEEPAKIGA